MISIALALEVMCIALLLQSACAQIKTGGIKTRVPSGNLLLDRYNETGRQYEQHQHFASQPQYPGQNIYTHTNENTQTQYANFVPAEMYPGLGVHDHASLERPVTQAPIILDETAQFINKTRAGMASGICYKEVPTSSLVRDSSAKIIGNGTTPNLSRIQICCEGYERNAHVFNRCDPICKDDCPNGICTAPNTCVCIPGHVRNHEERCIVTCPLGCGNGVCNDAGQCVCKTGYKLEPDTGKFCMPHCEQSCQFGDCVAPNQCACHIGYQQTASGTCEPKCGKCDFGKCTAPGVCTCLVGYKRNNDTQTCEPICTQPGGANAHCIAPETYECDKGYERDRSGICVPYCDQPCVNGVCVGNNTCKCNPGFIADEVQRNVCNAHCPQGCPNGYCTAPNFCVCKPGYIKSGVKGRQTCLAA